MTSSHSNPPIEVCCVDDDTDLREAIVRALDAQGFRARGFGGSRELYLGLLQRPCRIAVLDVGLPGEDGFSIAANLRANDPGMGIVMLTACGGTDHRVQGLLGGADAYLVKPVDMRELVATLHSLARRLGRPTEAASTATPGWHLALDGWCLVAPDATQISLTGSERALLQTLMRSPDLPVARDALVTALGHDSDYYLPHRLDMLIGRLRRKVLETAGRPLPLKAVRGVGFVFSRIDADR
ncbi:MAG: response regulator transcription factor [Ectothiorhodospiraceae bacterium]|jgi:DNA-binding response OmpR family regulator|nr:response regulator transcription factor [Ectothiorhodospiraceae bacterium]